MDKNPANSARTQGPGRQALARTSLAPHAVALIDDPGSQPGAGQIQLTVALCGLCGSDAHVYRADSGYEWVVPPMVLGHEAVGTITAVGSGVPDSFAPGIRVVPMSLVGCGTCEICARGLPQICPQRTTLGLSVRGAAAAQCLVPWQSLVPVPDSLPNTTAVLTEPASVAWRAVVAIGQVNAGDRVVVSGTGAVGLLAALIANYRGASVTLLGRLGPHTESKKILADRLGLRLETASPEPGTVDVWIEASGAVAQVGAALDGLRSAGKLVLVSLYADRLDFDVNIAVRKELSILTSYGSIRPDYEQALVFLGSIPGLGAEIVTVFPMAQAEDALRLTAQSSAIADGRILIKAAIAPNE